MVALPAKKLHLLKSVAFPYSVGMKHSNKVAGNLLYRFLMVVAIFAFSACMHKHDSKPVQVINDQQINLHKPSKKLKKPTHKHVDTPKLGISRNNKNMRLGITKKSSRLVSKRMLASKSATNTPNVTLKILTERLKHTDAIGVFTKLAIRSDIMDLKNDIQTYKQKSELQSKLKDIRARFDGLLMKIMALLDGDPDLSHDLYAARESIWKSLLGVKT